MIIRVKQTSRLLLEAHPTGVFPLGNHLIGCELRREGLCLGPPLSSSGLAQDRQELLSKGLLNIWVNHHRPGHGMASKNGFSSPHSLSANIEVLGNVGDYTEKIPRC